MVAAQEECNALSSAPYGQRCYDQDIPHKAHDCGKSCTVLRRALTHDDFGPLNASLPQVLIIRESTVSAICRSLMFQHPSSASTADVVPGTVRLVDRCSAAAQILCAGAARLQQPTCIASQGRFCSTGRKHAS